MTNNLLPLGSIVIMKGSTKKVMIMSRAIATIIEGQTVYFEYGACLYPEGLVGDQLLYFNDEDILKVIHQGFSDEEDDLMQENIQAAIQQSGLNKGTKPSN